MLNSIYELASYLVEKSNPQYPKQYTIIEYFPKDTDDINTYQPNIYELCNLEMDIENGVVTSIDAEGKLLNEHSNKALLMFLVDDLIYPVVFNEGYKYITISFDSGFIRILY